MLDYDMLTAESSSLSLGTDGIGNIDGTITDVMLLLVDVITLVVQH